MFSNITNEMILELDSLNLERFNYIKGSIEKGELTPPLVVRRFSDLAFSLAKKSMKKDIKFSIADPLLDIFENYLNSNLISIDTKAKMSPVIGETKLDLVFASGKHKFSSLRLAPYIMAKEDIKTA